jgi:hypothetical protein
MQAGNNLPGHTQAITRAKTCSNRSKPIMHPSNNLPGHTQAAITCSTQAGRQADNSMFSPTGNNFIIAWVELGKKTGYCFAQAIPGVAIPKHHKLTR